MTNSYTALIEALAGAPSLPGARCRGRHHLFDPARLGEHAEARHAQALGLCERCPALVACSEWYEGLPPKQRPLGVVAGRINPTQPAERKPHMPANTPISSALELIRYAKRTDDPVSGPTAVELATTGLDREQLASVLRLLFPFMAELYGIKRLSAEAMDRRDAQTFAELTQMLGNLDGYDPDAYDSDPVGDIWRSASTDGTNEADQ